MTKHPMTRLAPMILALVLCTSAQAAAPVPHNVILFVPDGLRAVIVDDTTAPTMAAMRRNGVDFANSHSIFPTFTTANAAAFATGHFPGDTGDFSNVIYPGFPVASAAGSLTPFLENNDIIQEIDDHLGGNYLNEGSVLAAAREAGYSTAAIGKLGPVAIQDVIARKDGGTLFIDDATNANGGIKVPADIAAAIKDTGLPAGPPPRSNDTANIEQQNYFLDVTTKVVLPRFKQAGKPFVLVFWSRDPDGTQHNQNDGHGALTPGINGPSAMGAIRNADNNLRDLQAALDALGLTATTDIIVSADHGFSTVSKQSSTSPAAQSQYNQVPAGQLPPGFLAIDLAKALERKLFDPDDSGAPVDPARGQFSKRGNGLIGNDSSKPDVIVAANGGSDLIYLPGPNAPALAQKLVGILLKQDYVSGLFVDDALGAIAGTLPLSAINLKGNAVTPTPAMLVNFRSYDTGCGVPVKCAVEIADTTLMQGQGMHGSFSRADTANFMAATGPDFKAGYKDEAPVSNADIGRTLSHILGLNIAPKGTLMGRVIEEALNGGPASVDFARKELRSQPAEGQTTILRYQTVGNTTYLDAAGFAGRTVGLQ